LAGATFVSDDHTGVLIDGELAWADFDVIATCIFDLVEDAPTSHVAAVMSLRRMGGSGADSQHGDYG
jgi:hypothetical protein